MPPEVLYISGNATFEGRAVSGAALSFCVGVSENLAVSRWPVRRSANADSSTHNPRTYPALRGPWYVRGPRSLRMTALVATEVLFSRNDSVVVCVIEGILWPVRRSANADSSTHHPRTYPALRGPWYVRGPRSLRMTAVLQAGSCSLGMTALLQPA